MICKFCGMDSATTDVCSWCGKSLRAAEPAPGEGTEGGATSDTLLPETSAAEGVAGTPPTTESILGAADPVATPGRLATEAVPPSLPVSASQATVEKRPGSAHRIAPGMPPPAPGGNRARMPAPGTPVPPTRSAPPPTTPISALADSAAASPLQSAKPVPTLAEQAENAFTLSATAAETVASRPLQPASQPTITPETAIGQGVSPPLTTTPTPSAAATVDASRRKASVDNDMAEAGPSPKALLLRYTGIFLLLLIVLGGLAYIGPHLYVIPMLLTMFVGALLLPVLHVTPWADEDSEDLAWFVLLTLLFGPLVALIIYSFVSLIRQGGNSSIFGCLAVAALARMTAEAGSSGPGVLKHVFQITSPFTSLSHIDAQLVKTLLLNWSGFVALAGWYAASTFHKENE